MKLDFLHEVIAGLVFLPVNSEPAYLDPGSGSFIIQIIIASLAAISYAFRSHIAKLGSFLRRSKDKDQDK